MIQINMKDRSKFLASLLIPMMLAEEVESLNRPFLGEAKDLKGARLLVGKKRKKKKKKVYPNHKAFTFGGVEVTALNEKNAIKKAKKLGLL